MIDSNLIKTSIDNIAYLDLKSILGVTSGITLRNDNFTEIQMYEFIADHCRRESGLPELRLIQLNQKHTSRVITSHDNLDNPADAVYTSNRGDILTIRTADCLPLLISDGRTVGLLHLGWRSILAGIIDKFFRAVPDLDKGRAKAVIGPAIRSCCFAVSPEVALLFGEKYRIKTDAGYRIDLERIVVDELSRFEVNFVYKSEACTFCQPQNYYSYRREGDDVRHLVSFICLGK